MPPAAAQWREAIIGCDKCDPVTDADIILSYNQQLVKWDDLQLQDDRSWGTENMAVVMLIFSSYWI